LKSNNLFENNNQGNSKAYFELIKTRFFYIQMSTSFYYHVVDLQFFTVSLIYHKTPSSRVLSLRKDLHKTFVTAVSLTLHKTFVTAVSLTLHKTFAERSYTANDLL